ncbi:MULTISPECIES: universal stress protein [unclassified Rathayibacter]|uniref:universal stress protein n=1 Tax=unclassified Rathayibacter TaxID=2609250 RepID=UPI0006FD507C|nr:MULTISPECIES: universal stress protein [unclassified Rathayibacter]KQQ03474.1 hypothetical protein ASF42_08130 [Rathayibacter sp. Leaf294]KQS11930.1 hypothetical protein ASG06_08130 [Rathayibacter sp. Leaf185]
MDDRIVIGAATTREGRQAVEWARSRAGRLGLDASALQIVESTATKPADTVHRLVEESRTARMIVVGAHSREDASHEFRHSPAFAVAPRAHCPVAIVPLVVPGTRSGVVVGVGDADREAVLFAASEADALGEELVIVHAVSPVNMWDPALMSAETHAERVASAGRSLVESATAAARLAHPALTVRSVVTEGFPAAVLDRAARHASLLVIGGGRHGRAAVAHELLTAPPCPAVVLPVGKEPGSRRDAA